MADQIATSPPARSVEDAPSPAAVDGDLPIAVIDAHSIHRAVAVAVVVVLVGGLWVMVADQALGIGDTLLGRVSARLFHLNWERGVPAVFSFLLLAATALSMWIMTFASVDPAAVGRYRARWRLLAGALLFVAFDELLVIHEQVSQQLRATFGFSGVLEHAWTIPYGLAALALSALMVAPLRALSRRPRALFLAGGLCYGFGAVVLEVVGAVINAAGLPEWVYLTEVFIEESAEIFGVWLILAGVLAMLRGASLRLVAR